MFFSYIYNNDQTHIRINIMSLDISSGNFWSKYIITGSPTLSKFYSVNDMLSFGGSGGKLFVVSTNEDTVIPKLMHIYYFTGTLTSTTPTFVLSSAFSIGISGLFNVTSLSNDPLNNNLAYVYFTDLYINGGTF